MPPNCDGRMPAAWVLWALAGVACFVPAARADEPDGADTVEGDEIVVVGRTDREPAAREATPFSQRLRLTDDPRELAELGDVLDAGTGVHVRRAGGIGRAQEIQLRGAGGHQLAVLLDGVPLPATRGSTIDLSTVPVAYIDRVDVIRGAAAASYGSGAQGGVIHLRTAANRSVDASQARIRAGSQGLFQLEAGHVTASDTWDALAVGAHSQAHGQFDYIDPNDSKGHRYNNAHERFNGLLRGRYRLPHAGRIGLVLEGLTDARGEPGPEQFDERTADSRQRRLLMAATWEDKGLAGGALPTQAVAYHAYQRSLYANPRPRFGGQPQRFELRDQTLGARARIAWTAAQWSEPALALEGRRETADTASGQSEPDRRHEARHHAAATLSWTIATPKRTLTGVGVLRIDDADTRRRAPMAVPKVGVEWRPIAAPNRLRLALRANVGRTFRDPGFDELYFQGTGIEGNPDLRPEDGYGWDAGAVAELKPWLKLEAVWFQQRYSRLILFVPQDFYRIKAQDNFGANVDGLELQARLRVRPLTLYGTYAYLRAHFDMDGQPPLPYRPAHRLYARATYLVGLTALYAAYDWRSSVTADWHGHRTLDAYGLLNLGMDGPITDSGLAVGFEIRNLLDIRDALDATQRPTPGRAFLASLRWDTRAGW